MTDEENRYFLLIPLDGSEEEDLPREKLPLEDNNGCEQTAVSLLLIVGFIIYGAIEFLC